MFRTSRVENDSVAALQDVLKAFKAKEMPSDEQLKARFAKDVEILKSRQNADGYFGLWKQSGERYKYPFVTAHVAHSLILAKAKGYQVPDEMLTKVKPYLKNMNRITNRIIRKKCAGRFRLTRFTFAI